jgi:type IV secretory pathway TraG/TraD family ATPase VirD4
MGWLTTVRMSTMGWTSGWKALVVAMGLLVIATAIWLTWKPASRDIHKRGAKILEGRRARRKALRLNQASEGAALTLGGVRIAPMDETKHFKLIGTTGTGKSTAIRELLRGALDRGDRAVITDPDSGYLRSFYDRYRGDIVLNPFEKHAVKWNPFTEIREIYDIDQLAGGLIPFTEDASGREWRGYARTFLSAVLRRCHQCGPHDVAELWRLLAIAPSSELRPIVAGTPAQPFLEPDNARMFGSIRSVAGSAAAALAYIKEQRALSFSVRDWVQSGRGVLFIPYQAGQIAALRSIIATWMRLAIVETMSHPEEDQRLWFVVDELDALGAIDGLKDALARLRKFGGRCVLGFQSIAQVSSTYGAGEAQTIVENCGNTLILRCSGSENGGTSQFASRLIGDREIVRRQTSRGRDRDSSFMLRGARRSTSTSEQHVTEAAVMPSQLEQLPDLTGYLKTASSSEWLRVAFSR